MLLRTTLIAFACLVLSNVALAEERRAGELFEVETTHVEQLSGFGVAIDPAAIMQSDTPPTSRQLSQFLDRICNDAGVWNSLPSWFNESEHALPVSIKVQVPKSGARTNDLIDCHVASLDARDIDGLVLAQVELESTHPLVQSNRTMDNTTYAVAKGIIDKNGVVQRGACMRCDCMERIAVRTINENTAWISLRLRDKRHLEDSVALLANMKDRTTDNYQAYFQGSKQPRIIVAVEGTDCLRVRVPNAYQDFVTSFVDELLTQQVVMPGKSTIAASEVEFDDPYLRTRQRLEQLYQQRIRSGLSYIPNVKIEVSADLDRVGTEGSIDGGYKPREVRASIAIPRTYVKELCQTVRDGNEVAKVTADELRAAEAKLKGKVERFVVKLLPRLSLGEDEYRQVEVIFFDPVAIASH